MTEYFEIQKDLSTIYRYLAAMEQDPARFEAMHMRRHKLLADLEKELNPKSYEGYVTELQVELQQINQTVFDQLYESVKDTGKKPKWSKLDHMRGFGETAIKYAKKALAVMEAKEDAHEYFQAIYNLRFTCAKLYSRFFAKEEQKQFEYLEHSYREYKALQDFTKATLEKNPNFELTETM